MEAICKKCGVRGWPETLVCCVKCSEAYEHRYCFDDVSKIFEQHVEWTCPDCNPRPRKLLPSPKSDESLRRSKRFSSINLKNIEDKKSPLMKTDPEMGLNGRKRILVAATPRKKCNNSSTIDFADLPLTVDLMDHSLSNGGCYVDLERRDPPSLDNNVETGSVPKEKVVSIFVDGFVPTATSCHDTSSPKDGSSIVLSNNCYMPAQPIVDPVWKGCFSICSERFQRVNGVAAHLSSKACLKVHEEACLLPANLKSYILPKADVWPKSFKLAKPSDDSIGLYFFPETESGEKIFNSLIDKMMSHDLALQCIVENAELLVFTSIELPLGYWRFQGNHYLWGVFRAKQGSCPSSASK